MSDDRGAWYSTIVQFADDRVGAGLGRAHEDSSRCLRVEQEHAQRVVDGAVDSTHRTGEFPVTERRAGNAAHLGEFVRALEKRNIFRANDERDPARGGEFRGVSRECETGDVGRAPYAVALHYFRRGAVETLHGIDRRVVTFF